MSSLFESTICSATMIEPHPSSPVSAATAAVAASSVLSSSVRLLAKRWCQWDPNPTTVAYVQALLQNETDNDELRRLFPIDNRRITFGTSGLRGRFQPGPLGMNDLVVVQTAQGLARYLEQQRQQQEQKNHPLRVVVGYDHRAQASLQLSSLQFALLTALVFLHAGWKKENVVVLDGYLPTPLVPFACQQLEAPLGIMITASHNPAQDAGYKIYYQACQILSPMDSDIQACIEQNLEPWTDYAELVHDVKQRNQATDNRCQACWGLSDAHQTEEIVDSYFTTLAQSGLMTGQYAKYQAAIIEAGRTETQNTEQLPQGPVLPLVVYTAMHGVGYHLAQRSFQTFSLPAFHSVPQQQDPDPTFPTVPFPNPEEPHALDLAKEYGLQQLEESGDATQRNIVILANDPDADRLAVAEYNAQDQTWITFTGDQIGILLGHWLWTQIGASSDKPVAMCQSLVSSRMLAEIGRVEGFRVDETLTGFKWIGTQAKKLHDQGFHVLLGYEESIGYCCGNVVFDKDGISALGVFAELVVNVYGGNSQEQREPCTLLQQLQRLYDKYGEFVSYNGYYMFQDPSVVDQILNKMRNGGQYDLAHVGEYAVASIRDLGVPGYDSTTPDHRPLLPTSRSSPMITITFTNGCVAQFRASGTESKFKYYIEMKGSPGVARNVVEHNLRIMAESILEILLEPSKHGLVAPTK